MADRGIIFSAPMVRALLDGRKTQTRRLVKPVMKPGVNPNFSQLRAHRHGTERWMLHGSEEASEPFKVPYAPGDRLYVREACAAEELSRPPASRKATRQERSRLKRTEVVDCDELDGADGVRFLADGAWSMIENTQEAGERWTELFHYGCKTDERPEGLRGRSVPSIHMPRWASRLTLTVTDVRVQRVAEISGTDARAEGVAVPAHVPQDGADLDWARREFTALWNSLHTKPGETWADNPWVVAVSFDVRHGNIDRTPA